MSILRKIYKKITPKKIQYTIYVNSLFFRNREKYNDIRKNRKQTVKYGSCNKDKHFFVCRRDHKATGLLACYLNILGQLIEIDKDVQSGKLIPVVDMFTDFYALIHNKGDGKMKINAWNYYFEPISDYSMEDVLKSKHVTLGYGYLVDAAKPFVQDYPFNKNVVEQVLPINNKYIRLKPELKNQFEHLANELFANKRVLGTNIREGYMVIAHGRDNKEASYNGECIAGHPVQPDIDTLCEELEKKMKEWDCDYIFAEYQTTYVEKKLIERFGEKFIHTNRFRLEIDELSLDSWNEATKKRKDNISMVENNICYLESIFMLSRCTSLISAKSSGTIVAALWNNDKYEHLEIINNGLY